MQQRFKGLEAERILGKRCSQVLEEEEDGLVTEVRHVGQEEEL